MAAHNCDTLMQIYRVGRVPPLPRFRYKGEAAKLRNLSQLRHVDPYQVSISPDGTEVVISLCRSATLDAQYLVSAQLRGLWRSVG